MVSENKISDFAEASPSVRAGYISAENVQKGLKLLNEARFNSLMSRLSIPTAAVWGLSAIGAIAVSAPGAALVFALLGGLSVVGLFSCAADARKQKQEAQNLLSPTGP